MSLPDPVRDYADQTIRTTLQHPEHLRVILEHAVPDLASNFVVEEAKLLGRDFYTEDWRRREADLPFEIPYQTAKGKDKSLVVVLIEHQSDTDRMMAARLLYFVNGYWDKCCRQWASQPPPRETLVLPPIVPIVFYTADRPWGSARSIAELLGPPTELHRYVPDFEPIFWNLSDETPDELLNSDNPWLQCMAVVRSRHEAFDAFREIFLQVLEKMQSVLSADRPRGAELLHMALTWTSASRTDPEREELNAQVQQTKLDATFTEEVKKMATQTAMTLAERVAQETTERVTKEVKISNSKELIKQFLEARFGSLDESLSNRIDQLDDLTQLSGLVTQAGAINNLEELKFPEEPSSGENRKGEDAG